MRPRAAGALRALLGLLEAVGNEEVSGAVRTPCLPLSLSLSLSLVSLSLPFSPSLFLTLSQLDIEPHPVEAVFDRFPPLALLLSPLVRALFHHLWPFKDAR